MIVFAWGLFTIAAGLWKGRKIDRHGLAFHSKIFLFANCSRFYNAETLGELIEAFLHDKDKVMQRKHPSKSTGTVVPTFKSENSRREKRRNVLPQSQKHLYGVSRKTDGVTGVRKREKLHILTILAVL